MSRLVAYLANDPDRLRCVLHAGRQAMVAGAREADSWGIGFYQGDEVLLQRRPKRSSEPVDFYAVGGALRTDLFIGHVRRATVGAVKNENTHPFRFRQWLFAHHGSVAPGGDFAGDVGPRLDEAIPDFLRRNIRGQTDSEHLFHLFLAFLHKAGALDDPMLAPRVAGEALRQTVAHVRSVVGPAAELDLAVTNGRLLFALRHGAPMYQYRLHGVRDCPVCRETADFGREPKRVDHEHLRGVVVVADPESAPGAPWEEVPDHTLIAIQHDLTVEFLPLLAAPAAV